MRRSAALALAAVLGMWLWQLATVHFNYAGNWTALFCINPDWPRPAFVATETLHTFSGSGYDGQMYHLIAHDPWIKRGAVTAMDDPALRYRRILVPALAWTVALGRDSAIHAAYFAVILGFVFLGVYWLARAMEKHGRHPAWGLMFALMPATLVSMDRMTVDIGLAALTAGFVLYCDNPASRWKVLLILACAALTRETGLLLTAGYGVFLLSRRRFTDLVWTAASALPAILWYLYVSRHTPSSPPNHMSSFIPLAGWIERVAHPAVYPLPRWQALAAVELDYIALAGVVLMLGHAVWLAWGRRWNARAAAIYVFGAAVIFLASRSVWEDAFGFGRVVTPLIILLAVEDARPRLAFAPVALIDARIGLNFLRQIIGVASHLIK
ncbi:MAG: hypothetical protein JWO19_1042 [Bryobacterales bacterium]|nr:hypothetical protein [Bryobacterales bacterium]